MKQEQNSKTMKNSTQPPNNMNKNTTDMSPATERNMQTKDTHFASTDTPVYQEKFNKAIEHIAKFRGDEEPDINTEWASKDETDIKISIDAINAGSMLDSYIQKVGEGESLRVLLGLLGKVYSTAAADKAISDVVEILAPYKYYPDILSDEKIKCLGKFMPIILKRIVGLYTKTVNDVIGAGQPNAVTRLMCRLAALPKDVTVYTPFATTNPFAVQLPNPIVGEEKNELLWAIGQIRLFAKGIGQNRVDIRCTNSFDHILSEGQEKYKAILTTTVRNQQTYPVKASTIRLLYDMLSDGGQMVCVVPVDFLSVTVQSQTNSGQIFSSKRDVSNLRRELIQAKAIKTVIMLPSEIFPGKEVQRAVLVLTKGIENDDIKFSDARTYTQMLAQEFRQASFTLDKYIEDYHSSTYIPGVVTSVAYSELQGTNLTPSIYLSAKPEQGIALSELADEVMPIVSPGSKAHYCIMPSKVPAGYHRKAYFPEAIMGEHPISAVKQVQLPDNAVILAIAGGVLRSVYTEGFTDKVDYPANFIKIFRPKDGVSARYLAAILSHRIVSDQIKAYTIGSTMENLVELDASHIMLPCHKTAKEQEQLISDILSAEMSELENELKVTLEAQKREVKSTRHAMIQTLSALSSNWEILNLYSEQHYEDGIRRSDSVGSLHPISVNELMGSISHAISTLQRQVEALRLEKTDWGKVRAINPSKVIDIYIATHGNPEVRMVNVGVSETSSVFYAPEFMLERIFNNIVANAQSHGFKEKRSNTHHEIRFDWTTDNGSIVITVANNGLPLKEGVTGADVLMSGYSTELNTNGSDGNLHSGIGGFEIKSLMEGFGSVEVMSLPESDFPVIYKLTFNKTNLESKEI